MEFLNRKENVIDIELTPYGKHLFSMGKFRPKFYSFHDNDVIYDTQYAGFGELQSETQDRIFETPRFKTQAAFEGAETRMVKASNLKSLNYNDADLFQYADQSVLEEAALNLSDYQPSQTKYYSLGGRLGTSRLTSFFAPSWNVRLIEGKILNPDDNIKYYTTASIVTEMVPQIDIEAFTTSRVVDPNSKTTYSETTQPLNLSFSDGTSLELFRDPLLIDIQENNTDANRPNFDVEVFEILKDEKDSEYLKPLKFGTKAIFDVYGNKIGSNLVSDANQDKRYVEYYIDISLDGEVQRSIDAPMPDLEDYDYSTPPFSVPPGPLSQIPVNDFLCPEEQGVNSFGVQNFIETGANPGTTGEATGGGAAGGTTGGGGGTTGGGGGTTGGGGGTY